MTQESNRRSKRAGRRSAPVMNVTPLVDVVLVLLIIFMVVIPAMESGANIDMPSILNVDEEARGRVDPLELSLASDGSFYFEREQLSAASVEARLTEVHTRDVMRRIVLKADRGTHYNEVRALFAMCQRIGFPGVSLKVNERRTAPATAVAH